MKFVPSSVLVNDAFERGYAVPAFCAWDNFVFEAAFTAASELSAPIMTMQGPGWLKVTAADLIVNVGEAVLDCSPVPAAIHLDHAGSIDLVSRCLNAGYTSVMLDFSTRSLEENVEGLRQVVELAAETGATVEGELGAVGRFSTSGEKGGEEELTDPQAAAEFVQETGIDMLAVSIGNVHGIYTGLPELDFSRLEQIRQKTGIPLVLHGGSSTPVEDLQKVISHGISKVNVCTEFVIAVQDAMLEDLQKDDRPWMTGTIKKVRDLLKEEFKRWIVACKADGKAEGLAGS
ncbi:MAG: ketose-bisphosphate aldolase [Candidatus Brocadiia bacterium]